MQAHVHDHDRARKPAFATLALILVMAASLLAATFPVPRQAIAQGETGLDSLAPASSLIYGEIELDQESDQIVLAKELLERANLEALLPEDQQALVDEGVAVAQPFLDGQLAFFLRELPVDDDTIDQISGQAADIAVDPASAVQQLPSGWAVIIRPTDLEATYEMLLEELENTVSDDFFSESTPGAELPVQVENYEGFEILSRPGDEWNSPMALVLLDEVVVAGSTPEDVKVVVDVAAGTEPAMSGVTEYQTMRQALPEQAIALGYIDGPAIVDAAETGLAEDLAEVPEDLLESLQAYQGFAVWADDPGFRIDSVSLAAAGIELDEISGYEPGFASIIPDTALTFTGGMDLGQQPALDLMALQMAQEILGIYPDELATPTDAEVYADEIFEEAAGVIGFNLKTDLLDNLSGEWAAAAQVDSFLGDVPEFAALFITEVTDADSVATVTQELTSLAEENAGLDYEVSTRDVSGTDVTVIEFYDDSAPVAIEFGVVDGNLVVGINGWMNLVEIEPANSLAADGTFQDTLDELPAGVTSVSYVNLQQVLPLVDEAVDLWLGTSYLDNDPQCGEYATQEEAQAALDEDPFGNYFLDLDWDGEACEDFFAPATPEEEATGVSDVNLLSFGAVTWADGDTRGTSAILLIGD